MRLVLLWRCRFEIFPLQVYYYNLANLHMANGLYVLGLVLGALILNLEAYEVVFSDDVTCDFSKGSIDVTGHLRQDWLYLPIVGFCGLAGKYTTPHHIDTSMARGTLYTTFEYLTLDCTAEYRRDINSCAVLTSAFGACFNFPLDRRTANRPWGYCSNFNFRVSYNWVTITNATAPAPATNFTTSSVHLESESESSSSPGSGWELPPVCSGFGCARFRDLGSLYKDIASLKKLQQVEPYAAIGGRLDTGCDWRYSNLVPVAWDGIQNVLLAGQSLQSSDNQYGLVMQMDCNLVLYKKGSDGKYEWGAKWATYSQFNDPFTYNCSADLRPNGNLIVRDPSGKPRWQSGGTTSTLYTSSLTVTRRGTVVVYEMTSGTVLWSAS